jgi:uracil-DNA glycosylase
MASTLAALKRHQIKLRGCTRCPHMMGPPVTGQPVVSRVMIIGQAPGSKEIEVNRPFAWTAGKTLFGWFSQIGLEEEEFRRRVYMAAVCRCFPGKGRSGDRVPNRGEIGNCNDWLLREFDLLQPELIVPVGKLAVRLFLDVATLDQVIGQQRRIEVGGGPADLIPLPHPSGASTWHRTQPGKTLLAQALRLIAAHPAWSALLRDTS